MTQPSRDATNPPSESAGTLAERALLVRGLRLATAVNTVPRAALGRPPLVLLPAAGHAWGEYRAVLERFAPERRVAALDWPGFGASDRPAPSAFRYSAEGYAELLGPWLDGLGIGRAVLLGNGVGGAAAVHFALAQPRRVAGLALVAPWGFTPPSPLRRLGYWALGHPWLLARLEPQLTALALGPANPATRAILAARPPRQDTAFIAASAALWRGHADLAGPAHAVRAPAIVVRGALDLIVTAAEARRATAALGEHGALEVVLPGAGHLPFLQQPGAFASALRGLLETVEAA